MNKVPQHRNQLVLFIQHRKGIELHCGCSSMGKYYLTFTVVIYTQNFMMTILHTCATTLSIQHNDTQHNGTQHNDAQLFNTQHNDTRHTDTKHNDTKHVNKKCNIQHDKKCDTQHDNKKCDTQHDNKKCDIQHNVIQHNDTGNLYAECHLC